MPHYVYEPSVRDEVLISRFVDISHFMLQTKGLHFQTLFSQLLFYLD